jgi:hypothetical protein
MVMMMMAVMMMAVMMVVIGDDVIMFTVPMMSIAMTALADVAMISVAITRTMINILSQSADFPNTLHLACADRRISHHVTNKNTTQSFPCNHTHLLKKTAPQQRFIPNAP